MSYSVSFDESALMI